MQAARTRRSSAGSVTGSSIGSCSSAALASASCGHSPRSIVENASVLRASDLEEPVRVVENLRWLQAVEQFARLPDREPEPGHDPQLAVARLVSDQPLPGLSRKATDESIAVLADRLLELSPRVDAPVWKAVEHAAREERPAVEPGGGQHRAHSGIGAARMPRGREPISDPRGRPLPRARRPPPGVDRQRARVR